MNLNNYAEKIFKLDLYEITIDILQKYFSSPQEETSIVEFKSGNVEIIDIYKEIAAFLNTEGGILIIGAPVEQKKKIGKNILVYCEGELTSSKFKDKTWLSQKINSNIVPTPTGIKIQQIETDDGLIFILDIPQSIDPPHQVISDGRYYIRIETEAKPAPHGFVQAMFQKRKFPQLDAKISFENIAPNLTKFHISLSNLSKIPADAVSYIVEIYNIVEVVDGGDFFTRQDDSVGIKYSYFHSTEKVLVRIVSMPIDFSIYHNQKEVVLTISFWSKNSDFDSILWKYDTVKREIKNKTRFNDLEDKYATKLIEATKERGHSSDD